jgi:hypothetical protein
MSQPAIRPQENSPAKEVIERTVVEFQHDRGILYVYASDQTPLLKITGLPLSIPPLSGASEAGGQLSIDIPPDSTVCTWKTARAAAGGHTECQTLSDNVDARERVDTARVLRAAGATIRRTEQ